MNAVNMPGLETIQVWLVTELVRILDIESSEVDIHASFASYGLVSADAIELVSTLEDWLGIKLSNTLIYDYPNIEALSLHLAGDRSTAASKDNDLSEGLSPASLTEPVAVIGIGCRFPGGVNSPEDFWRFLCSEQDAMTEIPADRWDINAFYSPDPQAPGKMYTRTGCFVQNIDRFDARFFGLSPREAMRMDPQQRMLIETAWEALEHAGLPLEALDGSKTGVFVGMMSSQEYVQLQIQDSDGSHVDDPYFGPGGATSVAAGRLSYLFNLKGPALTVDTACSSSLVATHLACQSLRSQECQLALVGGVNAILLPENMVNFCKMGMLSVDGSCKTFDASADGFVLGEGCGVVVLKRLAEAVADGNPILGVIRGSAVNQDGRSNGLTAPNKLAQAALIRQALANAGVSPLQVQYVEAHGSGTALGDPIEVDALMAALGKGRPSERPLLIGSVKTNIGYLAGAAGMAGLIKTVLALHHQEIPSHLHVQKLNPYIDWQGYPVEIVRQRKGWQSDLGPRVAGVSSFGWSGTNAHVVLEEAPGMNVGIPEHADHVLVLSARTEASLEQATDRLVAYLQEHPASSLADVAYTSQLGRTVFDYRRAVVCQNVSDAIRVLAERDPRHLLSGWHKEPARPVALLFPGLGENLGDTFAELYRAEATFRSTVDQCCRILYDALGLDLLTAINDIVTTQSSSAQVTRNLLTLPGRRGRSAVDNVSSLNQTALAQPALFIMEYALAMQLQQCGVRPAAMLGYSLGEYVAACLAGVFSLEDALILVAKRARLIQEMPQGAMLALALSPDAVKPYLNEQINLAAINAPFTCVLSGPVDAIERLSKHLEKQEIVFHRVETLHAFHSTMLSPVREALTELVRSIPLHTPQIPYLSNVSGTWITNEQATDPAYWADHMCQMVRFADGVAQLLSKSEFCVLEVGPGQSLTSFTRQHPGCVSDYQSRVLALLPVAYTRQTAHSAMLVALSRLWLAGVTIDWKGLYAQERRMILPLPTYPFERKRYWIDLTPRRSSSLLSANSVVVTKKREDISDWFYQSVWEATAWPAPPPRSEGYAADRPWLIFLDQLGLGEEIAHQLILLRQTVVCVLPGEQFAQIDEYTFSVAPGCRTDYDKLCVALRARGLLPEIILHNWNLAAIDEVALMDRSSAFRAHQEQGFYSLLFLTQALQLCGHKAPMYFKVISNHAQSLASEDEYLCPEKATLQAACKVIQQEYSNISCYQIDLALSGLHERDEMADIDHLLAECRHHGQDHTIVYRDGKRWVLQYRPLRLEKPQSVSHFRERGVYLITGGLGGIALELASYLAGVVQARIVLVGRSRLPDRSLWAQVQADPEADTHMRRKIEHIQHLEELGAEVLVLQADVADQEQMQHVLEQTLARFGALHGVFHAAGNLDPKVFKPIQDIGREECEAHFQAKVYGTMVLERMLRGLELDFCVLFSSISAVLGGLGFVGYAASNNFLDAFVRGSMAKQSWISVNWDTWLTDGIKDTMQGTTLLAYAMEVAEGIEALDRVLTAQSTPNIINSTGDLQVRTQEWLQRTQLTTDAAQPQITLAPLLSTNDYERRIAEIWKQALGFEEIQINDNFFDLGGNSLIGMQVIGQINKAFQLQLPTVTLFEAPTISTFARCVQASIAPVQAQSQQKISPRAQARRIATDQNDIAIVGMAGRFPGATTIEQFWQNLRNGVESISFFSQEELAEAGVPLHLLQKPNYVRARPVLTDIELFDAAFFGYSPRDAELLDPQHRLFLECCWEALEVTGYDVQTYDGLIGVYGGSAMSTYLLSRGNAILSTIDDYQLVISNDKDSLTTTVSYKLNLKGPSFAVQTFCSTSLVATHLACQSLLRGECDMAVAGGVSVRVPEKSGYLYEDGGMESPDGHCRTFDAQAKGSIFGDGVGVVVLKRLEDALADGDSMYAVIKGSAINNDGSLKVSYSAPGVVGQTEAIKAALDAAGVSAESISYVEAHGTGTELGDPIEVTSLTRAFTTQTERRQFCAIGSVKTNVGHLDRAAGISGLIKTALALKHEEIPANLHYQSPNPEIDFENSPFYVNTRLTPWKHGEMPRRALVNSLGMGGTNAHLVLEEAPFLPPSAPSRPQQLLVLSAQTATALETATNNLLSYLQRHPIVNLADVAYTLQVGRSRFKHRRMLVCRSREEALHALSSGSQMANAVEKRTERSVVFLFPSEEEQWLEIAHTYYQQEENFCTVFDQGCELIQQHMGVDLRQVLALEALSHPRPVELQADLIWPSRLLVQYALAQLLLQSGVHPQIMSGYGLGELVVACLAGVLSLESALLLAIRYAQSSQAWPQQEPEPRTFAELLPGLKLNVPLRPFLSSVTGTWITGEKDINPARWAQLPGKAVSNNSGLEELLREPDHVFLTIGSVHMLNSQVVQGSSASPLEVLVAPSSANSGREDTVNLLSPIGQLWLAGVPIDWSGFYQQEKRYRIPLPSYPFERQRYWIEPGAQTSNTTPVNTTQKQAMGDWFYLPGWKQTPPVRASAVHALDYKPHWLFFLDDSHLGERIIQQLRLDPADVTMVVAGEAFSIQKERQYTIHPGRLDDYVTVLRNLQKQDKAPTSIVHLWSVTPHMAVNTDDSQLEEILSKGFYSLLLLAQALGNLEIQHCTINVISNGMHNVTGYEPLYPEKATLLGPCRVISQEYATISCRSIDITMQEAGSWQDAALLRLLEAELLAPTSEKVVAFRNHARWVQTFEPMRLEDESASAAHLRQGGVYLITGGLGGIGLMMAEHLAQTLNARLVLVGRGKLPPRREWPDILTRRGDQDSLGRRLQMIQRLEQQGTELLIIQADVTDEAQMRSAFKQALNAFGTIHGILHAAGVPGVGLMQVKTPAAAGRVLAPKVLGIRIITQLLRQHQLSLDFLALFSSVTSTTAGPGQVDYCAANAYLDAYACAASPQQGITISIDWSEWQWNDWEAGLGGYDAESQQFFRSHRQTFGITAQEGTEAFRRALASSQQHVIVSPAPFKDLLELSTIFTANAVLQRTREQQQGRTKHQRPNLGSTYVPPRSDVERQIAAIWEDLLGITPVGINDNFFDLGGNSLVGLDLIARLRKALQIDTLAAYIIYEAPSVSALALSIEQGKATNSVDERHDRGARRREVLRKRIHETR